MSVTCASSSWPRTFTPGIFRISCHKAARTLWTYNTHVFHGLLQTEDYARVVLAARVPTLDEEEIVPWARKKGLPEDIGALAADESVRELIQDELDRVNSKYAKVEQIKKFTILDHDLSQETGELTPTMKVKRAVVNDSYADVFDAMYA